MNAPHRAAAVVAALLATGLGSGCGSSDADPQIITSTAAAGAGGGGGGTAGSTSTGGTGGGSGGSGPSTHPYDPCATADCWSAPALGACGSTAIDENFSSGNYNVHRYLVMAPADVDVDLRLTRTAGSWSPTLIVHDEQGTTVFDGEQTHSTSSLQVTDPSSSADEVAVRVRASTRQHLAVFATGASVVASDFSDPLPTDAEYTVDSAFDCTPPAPLTVRGIQLNARQELWVRYIAAYVVPHMLGTRAERIDKAAYVAWWSLKEGVLHVPNPLSYSNCSIPPDQHIGPLELCPNPSNAWQVGVSAVQVTGRTVADVEALALSEFPEQSVDEILTAAAIAAGLGASTALGQAVVGSTDRLRVSWLLRSGPVGFEAEYPVVYGECFVDMEGWCFNSASFAPSQSAALDAIADLTAIFETLSP
ncbi:MAG: hypothetical protein JRI23_32260 [Deltaproteobacteria bacterium]|nr:hypothetical protein [Deltaproteobacteria bacterium]MBW2536915.1 hypothetical protein [Deltaproteobacteria bacterium]